MLLIPSATVQAAQPVRRAKGIKSNTITQLHTRNYMGSPARAAMQLFMLHEQGALQKNVREYSHVKAVKS